VYGNLKTKLRLDQVLQEIGITEEELAEKAGISSVVINQFEGSYNHVDLILVRIARALNLNVEDLFEIKGEEKGEWQRISGYASLCLDNSYC
jgi:DNA-binding Xre family transcriptional regulator